MEGAQRQLIEPTPLSEVLPQGRPAACWAISPSPPLLCLLHVPQTRSSLVSTFLQSLRKNSSCPHQTDVKHLKAGTHFSSNFPQPAIRLARNVCFVSSCIIKQIHKSANYWTSPSLWGLILKTLAYFCSCFQKGRKEEFFLIFCCHFLNVLYLAILHFLLISTLPVPVVLDKDKGRRQRQSWSQLPPHWVTFLIALTSGFLSETSSWGG